ncbi:MAG: OmpA family protein [Bacteroidia bacterium]|nr:OmpA family protein [Bacteroidia bacterium]
MNLLDIVKEQVTGSLSEQAAGFLGEDKGDVTNALGAIFPSLLGNMVKSAKGEGAQKLFDMATGMDSGFLGDIGGLFSGGSSNVAQLMNSGSGILNLLMGSNAGSFIDKISSLSGLKGSSTSSLIKMAAPFLMSKLGSQIKEQNLDLAGLAGMLGGQSNFIKNALPSNLMDSLDLGIIGEGLSSVGGMTGAIKDTVTDGAEAITGGVKDAAGLVADKGGAFAGKTMAAAAGTLDTGKDVLSKTGDTVGDLANAGKKAGGSLMKYLIPAVIVLALLSWFGIKTCSPIDNAAEKVGAVSGDIINKTGELAGDAADMTGDAVNAVGSVASAAFKSLFSVVDETAKKALDNIQFVAGSAGDQIMKYINGGFEGDANFKFNNLTFDTGKAAMTAASAGEVDNIAAIMKAYPNVKISIDGYTDNTGDAEANVQLSKARAEAVKARLIGAGVAGDRLKTFGHGSDNPVADNNTEEGRNENRRIEINIVQ